MVCTHTAVEIDACPGDTRLEPDSCANCFGVRLVLLHTTPAMRAASSVMDFDAAAIRPVAA
jgi:hypothetical protein